MALNFDSLADNKEFDSAPVAQASGKPLAIALKDIAEDPNNPRTDFDAEYLKALAEDIRESGVKSPVSVRANPTGETPWMLNYGACRYRASALAGKGTIPGFVDEQFTDYDKVNENEQRKNLSAMELALFIQRRKREGDSNAKIAEKLRKDRQTITHHMALIDMPEAIDKAYREGKVVAARAVYDLVRLHQKYPEKVGQWCQSAASISRPEIELLSKKLAAKEVDSSSATKGKKTQPKHVPFNAETHIAIPALSVQFKGRDAVLLLERRPTKTGKVFIRFIDDLSEMEVKGTDCRIVELSEASELVRPKAKA